MTMVKVDPNNIKVGDKVIYLTTKALQCEYKAIHGAVEEELECTAVAKSVRFPEAKCTLKLQDKDGGTYISYLDAKVDVSQFPEVSTLGSEIEVFPTEVVEKIVTCSMGHEHIVKEKVRSTKPVLGVVKCIVITDMGNGIVKRFIIDFGELVQEQKGKI